MRYAILFFVAALALGASAQEKSGKQFFGEKISKKGAISVDELFAQMGDQESFDAKVAGTVESVCQMKGCWMNLTGSEGSMMVRFKDYGFFVPKDIATQEVIIEGTATRELTSVEDLKHYAEDQGKSQEEIDKITEPKMTYKFLAHGVILMPKKA